MQQAPLINITYTIVGLHIPLVHPHRVIATFFYRNNLEQPSYLSSFSPTYYHIQYNTSKHLDMAISSPATPPL